MVSAKPAVDAPPPVNDTTVDDEEEEQRSTTNNDDGETSDIINDSPRVAANQRPMSAPAPSKPLSTSIAIDTSKCSRTSDCKCSACTIPIEALPVLSSTAPVSSHFAASSTTTATQRIREQRSKQAAASVKPSVKTEKYLYSTYHHVMAILYMAGGDSSRNSCDKPLLPHDRMAQLLLLLHQRMVWYSALIARVNSMNKRERDTFPYVRKRNLDQLC